MADAGYNEIDETKNPIKNDGVFVPYRLSAGHADKQKETAVCGMILQGTVFGKIVFCGIKFCSLLRIHDRLRVRNRSAAGRTEHSVQYDFDSAAGALLCTFYREMFNP